MWQTLSGYRVGCWDKIKRACLCYPSQTVLAFVDIRCPTRSLSKTKKTQKGSLRRVRRQNSNSHKNTDQPLGWMNLSSVHDFAEHTISGCPVLTLSTPQVYQERCFGIRKTEMHSFWNRPRQVHDPKLAELFHWSWWTRPALRYMSRAVYFRLWKG